jgi:ATP-dependent helicase/nuclease subunit A
VPPASAVFDELPNGLASALTEARIREPLWACAGVWGRGTAAKQKLANELEEALTHQSMAGVLAALLTKDGEPKKRMGDEAEISAAQTVALRLLAAGVQDEAHQHHQRMVRLSRLALAEYAALKRERGWVDMGDVEAAAQALLGDPVLGAWVQQGLDARVSQLLIDEFQDTNPMQWQALHTWLAAYAGAGGGGTAPVVFIVGDPKQSIYRFRRAEPQVFAAAQAFVVQGLAGSLLSCDHTRRCAVAVVDAVNAVMLAAQSVNDYSGYRPHSAQAALEPTRALGRVGKLPLIAYEKPTKAQSPDAAPQATAWRDSLHTPQVEMETRRRDLEAAQAADWIAAELAAGHAPQDFMVLARKRLPLRHMAQALQARAIAFAFAEKENLIDKPEVQDLVALLDALVSPTHNLSLAQALKSPLFALSDGDLVTLANLADSTENAEENSKEGSKESNTDGRKGEACWLDLLALTPLKTPAGKPLHATLLQYQHWLASLPPHDALAAIYHHADVPARFAAFANSSQRQAVLGNLQALLAAALSWQGGRYSTAYAFIRALKRGDVAAPEQHVGNAVHLLTIHGAKGLQAHTVLVLDGMAAPAKAESQGELPAPQDVVFLPSESRPPLSAAALVAQEQAAGQREELNALYVAMTRAQERLIFSGLEPGKNSKGMTWWARVESFAEDVPMNADVEADMLVNRPVDAPIDPPTAASGDAFLNAPEPAKTTSGQPRLPEQGDAVFILPSLPSLGRVAKAHTLGKNANENISAAATLHFATASAVTTTDSAASRIGQAMHRLLQWCEWVDESHKQVHGSHAARAQVQQAFELTAAEAAQAQQMALQIVQGEAAWAWQRSAVDWQANELVLSIQGQSLRLDRLVRRRDTGEWWVLDFKSAHAPQHSAPLQAQMQRYVAAVEQALASTASVTNKAVTHDTPNAKVRAALLSAQGNAFEVVGEQLTNSSTRVDQH